MLRLEDVMKLLNIGRPTATRYMSKYLGKNRVKGQKYLVPREGFIEWINNGMS